MSSACDGDCRCPQSVMVTVVVSACDGGCPMFSARLAAACNGPISQRGGAEGEGAGRGSGATCALPAALGPGGIDAGAPRSLPAAPRRFVEGDEDWLLTAESIGRRGVSGRVSRRSAGSPARPGAPGRPQSCRPAIGRDRHRRPGVGTGDGLGAQSGQATVHREWQGLILPTPG